MLCEGGGRMDWFEVKRLGYNSNMGLASNLEHVLAFTMCTDLSCSLKPDYLCLNLWVTLALPTVVCGYSTVMLDVDPVPSQEYWKYSDKTATSGLTGSEISPSSCRKESVVGTRIAGLKHRQTGWTRKQLLFQSQLLCLPGHLQGD